MNEGTACWDKASRRRAVTAVAWELVGFVGAIAREEVLLES
jgi:hypothetical protein